VLVGGNRASATYVASKKNMSAQSGIRSFDHRLPATISEAELLALIVA
jgi:methylenetetrahydrofolate dehydrogenase (NADP+) / methenyltetrahydrofolate cyclohydrolase